jgi:hypothetical protein
MSTLCFLPDGKVKGIYTETIDLGALGPLQISRATSIEFDNRLQAWHVFDPYGDCMYCSPSRQVCLDWEQQHLSWVLESQ